MQERSPSGSNKTHQSNLQDIETFKIELFLGQFQKYCQQKRKLLQCSYPSNGMVRILKKARTVNDERSLNRKLYPC
jgi:hypothetical protein